MIKKRKRYDREFKEMIVELYRSGKKAQDISKEFDVSADLVCRWSREEYRKGEQSFQEMVRLTSQLSRRRLSDYVKS